MSHAEKAPKAPPVKVKATYTPIEVAKMMGRPKSVVYRWCDTGALVTVKIGNQRLIPLAALRTHALVWESIQAVRALAGMAAL